LTSGDFTGEVLLAAAGVFFALLGAGVFFALFAGVALAATTVKKAIPFSLQITLLAIKTILPFNFLKLHYKKRSSF
jgi:hypothetical protein